MAKYEDKFIYDFFNETERTKQIEDNLGKTLISEGIEANYLDMINYSVFAMIKLEFGEE
jgi:hypothetical protein